MTRSEEEAEKVKTLPMVSTCEEVIDLTMGEEPPLETIIDLTMDEEPPLETNEDPFALFHSEIEDEYEADERRFALLKEKEPSQRTEVEESFLREYYKETQDDEKWEITHGIE